MLIDYHIHSRFSPDSQSHIYDIAAQAVLAGLKEIAITDHYDVYSPGEYNWTAYYDRDGFFAETAKIGELYSDNIAIKKGLEIGNPHRDITDANTLINSMPYDFIVAAIHKVESCELTDFNYRTGDTNRLKHQYLEELQRTVAWGNFDVLAHITLPNRYALQQKTSITFTPSDFREIFTSLIKQNKGIELNLSGLHNNTQEIHPTREILAFYKECGGEIITMGTDAHKPQNVGKFTGEGLDILMECGFTKIYTYENRVPKSHPIERVVFD